MSFVSRRKDYCQHIVNEAQFDVDALAGQLPHYAFYSPNLDNDGHDPVDNPQEGLREAAGWLERFLRKYRPLLSSTLIVVTFDESRDAKNNIYTVFLGDMVRPDTYDQPYTHYNILRTIEENFHLGHLADGDSCAKPIERVWR